MNIQNIDLFEMHEPLTGSFPFAALTAVLPDDISSVSIHWQDTMEILLIREGTGQVSIDLEKISVKKGDICLVLPGQLHSIDADSNSSLKISMIQFPLSLLSGSTDNDDAFAFLKPLSEGEQVIPWLITPEDGWYNEFRQCFEEMFQLQTFYSAAYPLGIKSCLFRLFYLLFYNESTEQMAKVCEFSESHFIKFFKSTIGITFTECLNSYRLSQASRLLLADTDEPIMDIARKCGFKNIPHFNRVFKKKYGITPSVLRGTKSSPETADPSLS